MDSNDKTPNYDLILKSKIDYYGETKAAYHFAAEEYARQVSQSQSSEIERLKEENEKLAKLHDRAIEHSEELLAEISSLKSQLEAKAVDVEALQEKFRKWFNEQALSEYLSTTQFHKIFKWWLDNAKHLQTGKSEAVEFFKWVQDNFILTFDGYQEINPQEPQPRGPKKYSLEELYELFLKTKV